MGKDLSDPAVFERAYDEHSRSVYNAAYRIVGNQAQAQDVVQDVFMRDWRRPRSFDAGRGELGSYLRMVARSRALDLWREGGRNHTGAGEKRAPESARSFSRPSRIRLLAVPSGTSILRAISSAVSPPQ